MSYLVIARKFRPQTFGSIVGQEHISRALATAILRGRVPHALLLTGPRGVGKTTTARVLARALNCRGRPLVDEEQATASVSTGEYDACNFVEPCGECENCREIAKSSSMAVWEIDGASNNGVENVRQLIDSLRSVPPPGSKYKIYIIDEVHMLSVAAFNALLKSLEEPPPNTIFIFATTEPHKIPETVISRCQRHDFRRIKSEVIVTQLREIASAENIKVDEEVLWFLARRAQGGMRDAQSMFDRLIAFSRDGVSVEEAQYVFGVLDQSYFFKLGESVRQGDAQGCFQLLDGAFSGSLDVKAFIGDFLMYWRNLLLLEVKGTKGALPSAAHLQEVLQVSAGQLAEMREQAGKFGSFDLQRLFEIAETTAQRAVQSAYPRYVLEAGLAKMATLADLRPLPELIGELRALGTGQMSSAFVAAERNEVRAEKVVTPQVHVSKISDDSEEVEPVEEDILVDGDEVDHENATKNVGEEISPQEVPSGDFNPSWRAFVAHVGSRRMPILEAVLKRVSPREFVIGSLLIDANDFDCEVLSDAENLKFLRSCLHSYSGSDTWNVRFAQSERLPFDAPTGEAGRTNGVGLENGMLTGSIAQEEKVQQAQLRQRMSEEARQDPLVKAILENFAGSKIEKIELSGASRLH